MKRITVLSRMKTCFFLCVVFSFLISGGDVFAADTPDHSAKNSEAIQKEKTIPALHSNGLRFTPNRGQVIGMDGKPCPNVLYKADAGGAIIYLRETGISYVYTNLGAIMHEVEEEVEEMRKVDRHKIINELQVQQELIPKKKVKAQRVDMDFINCNTPVNTINEEELEGYQNYYYDHCPEGISQVKQFGKITYKNIYNNIDVSYYGGKQNGIKYTIVVQPHADPGQIQLYWKGAENIRINHNGSLVIETKLNEFTESIPKVYQLINGQIIDVKARYILTPVSKGEAIVGFSLSDFNPTVPLIIDPWATYYGGSDSEDCQGMATDNSGNVVITGNTFSTNFPVLSGYQLLYAGSTKPWAGDAYVVKLDPNGALMWATYYGGSDWDYGSGISADKSGNIFFAGVTASSNFPILAGGYSQAYAGGGSDAFVVKLNSSGTLLWSTFYGGSAGQENSYIGVATDNAGNVFLKGSTGSSDFPTLILSGGYSQAYLGGPNGYGFLVMFNSGGTRLFATFWGGGGGEYCTSIAVDGLGNALITGITAGGFPASGGFQMTIGGGFCDAYVLKFNPNGTILWGTYFGGNSWDWGWDVAIDSGDNIIITGWTSSPNFPVTAGAYQSAFGGSSSVVFGDVFIAKFTSAGSLLWSTYYGAKTDEYGRKVATDASDNIYVLMEAEHVATPALVDVCSYQPIFNGGSAIDPFNGTIGKPEDQIVVKFKSTGEKTCATYAGGTGEDELESAGGGMAIYGNSLYIAGSTDGGYPVTAGAFQTVCGGMKDVFIASLCTNICEGQLLGLNFSANTTSVCPNVPVTFSPTITNSCDTANYKFSWTFTGGNPASSTSAKPTVTFSGVGTHDVALVLTTLCKTDTVKRLSYITVNSCGVLSSGITKADVQCNGKNTGTATVTATGGTPDYTYAWSNGSSSVTSAVTNTISGLLAGAYTVSITDGSSNTSTALVSITQPLALTSSITSPGIICFGTTTTATALPVGGSPGYMYSWSPIAQTGSSATNLNAGTVYSVTVTDNNGCTAASTISITSPAAIGINPIIINDATCGQNNGTAIASASGGTGSLSYSWSNGSSGQTTINLLPGIVSVTISDANTCTKTATGTVANTGGPTASLTVTSSIICNGGLGTITASAGGGNSPYTYNWSTGVSSIGTSTTQQLSNLPANTYTVTITDNNTCISTTTLILSAPAPLSLSPVVSNANCTLDNGRLKIVANGGTPAYTYSWSNATVTATDSIYGLAAGIYSVTVSDSKGCTATQASTIGASGQPVLNITPAQQTITAGSSVDFTVTGAVNYSWSPKENLTCENCANPTATPLISTTYTILATDANGCTVTAMVRITVNQGCVGDDADVFIANTFSPNSDGANDVLNIKGNGLKNIYWAIYDRWGNLMFETLDQSRGWDGSCKGNPVEAGTYVYYLKATCIKTNNEIRMKGNVSIVR